MVSKTNLNIDICQHANNLSLLMDPAFNTRSHTQNASPSTTPTPHPNISPRISQGDNPNPNTTDSRQIRSFTTNVENRPILQMYIKMTIKW